MWRPLPTRPTYPAVARTAGPVGNRSSAAEEIDIKMPGVPAEIVYTSDADLTRPRRLVSEAGRRGAARWSRIPVTVAWRSGAALDPQRPRTR